MRFKFIRISVDGPKTLIGHFAPPCVNVQIHLATTMDKTLRTPSLQLVKMTRLPKLSSSTMLAKRVIPQFQQVSHYVLTRVVVLLISYSTSLKNLKHHDNLLVVICAFTLIIITQYVDCCPDYFLLPSKKKMLIRRK